MTFNSRKSTFLWVFITTHHSFCFPNVFWRGRGGGGGLQTPKTPPGSAPVYCPASPQTKSKSMKKHRARTTISTSREQTAITYNSLDALQQNRFFELFLRGRIRWYPVFNRWPLPSPRTRCVKKWTDFFQISNYLPNVLISMRVSMLYTEKICIALLCSVFADPVTIYLIHCMNHVKPAPGKMYAN